MEPKKQRVFYMLSFLLMRKSEKYLLWMVGILMLFFSNVVAKQILETDGRRI